MNESDTNEQVSAFMDGESRGSESRRVVDELYRDPERRRTWARYHLIGDALRRTGSVPGADRIADGVKRQISDERVVAIKPRFRPGIWAPLPGLALAASVAAVAILGIRALDGGSDLGSTPSSELASQEPDAMQPTRPSTGSRAQQVATAAAQRFFSSAAHRPWSDAPNDAGARINTYLVNHSEHGGHGLRGVLPYVRVVGYQPGAGVGR